MAQPVAIERNNASFSTQRNSGSFDAHCGDADSERAVRLSAFRAETEPEELNI
jgi:hypothetical protein